MPSMLLLLIALSVNGYAPLTPRPCSPIVHHAQPSSPLAVPVSDYSARDALVQAACPFVSLHASGSRALVVRFRIDGVQRAELRTALEERNAVRSGSLVTGGDAVLSTITDALRSRTAGPGP